ncbi:MAG: hypothetical protein M1299_00290 [Firmicutes bacterium]|nr:hypothetical protein [Bacillota bacterium]MCL5038264.1 hypothetical protein [Bacillota bacterium]
MTEIITFFVIMMLVSLVGNLFTKGRSSGMPPFGGPGLPTATSRRRAGTGSSQESWGTRRPASPDGGTLVEESDPRTGGRMAAAPGSPHPEDDEEGISREWRDSPPVAQPTRDQTGRAGLPRGAGWEGQAEGPPERFSARTRTGQPDPSVAGEATRMRRDHPEVGRKATFEPDRPLDASLADSGPGRDTGRLGPNIGGGLERGEFGPNWLLRGGDILQGIVLAEILGPPVGMRRPKAPSHGRAISSSLSRATLRRQGGR